MQELFDFATGLHDYAYGTATESSSTSLHHLTATEEEEEGNKPITVQQFLNYTNYAKQRKWGGRGNSQQRKGEGKGGYSKSSNNHNTPGGPPTTTSSGSGRLAPDNPLYIQRMKEGLCLSCGEKGHLSRACPIRIKSKNGEARTQQ